MTWKFEGSSPIYLQIIERLKNAIAAGTYPPGSKMPSVRDLALEAGVNPNTVQRAFAELEREGYLYSQRTTGRYVTEDRQKLSSLRIGLGRKYIKELFDRLSGLGLSTDDIVRACDAYAKEEKNA
ncbi:MAG: GntR family transcriptional regulator [Galactobacillus timonensis]|uniref:GntR family transcriptional regulator n=1 Tax=Galactobacillus timonensis TaxID=2041840 RepID=UPI000C83D85A|nr:GntR family transcriptional regulator [Galactobacillus timonensis]MCI6754598.1 GntR family transcriptional regulator [Galactobacillus timonensis]MDD6600099.1 GntR family transcriptional regulator [Galactobacillus timonensis]MDY6282425.1 GntR family transcriptional regulator [Erysipelotrichaceae bacterium]